MNNTQDKNQKNESEMIRFFVIPGANPFFLFHEIKVTCKKY